MKTILIAGGKSGIGLQAARDLLADGHRLVLLGRDPRKGEAALTQLLLPALHRAERPVVLMMTAAVPPVDDADFARFPQFTDFSFGRDRKPVQLANHHYAAYLTHTTPGLAAGVVNAGAA